MNLNLNWINDTIKNLHQWWPIVKSNFQTIMDSFNNHVSGTADKHSGEAITLNPVGKTKITAGEVQTAIDQVEEEIKNFIDVSANAEVGDAHVSTAKGKTFPDIRARFEESEEEFIAYKSDSVHMVSIIPFASLQAAVDAVQDGTRLFIPPGTITVNVDTVISKNLMFIGIPGKSIIKIADNTRIRNILMFGAIKSVHIYGIIFDMNMQNTPVYQASDYVNGSYNGAAYFNNVTDEIDIQKCKFINLYNESLSFYQSAAMRINIEKNTFSSPAQSQNLRLSHISMQTMVNPLSIITIEDNIIDNTKPTSPQYGVNAIFAEGVKCKALIQNNNFNWCGRDNVGSHRLLAIDFYGNCSGFTVKNNKLDNCLWGFVRMESCQDMLIEDNDFIEHGGTYLTDPAIWIVNSTNYEQICQNIKIKGNKFYAYTNSRITTLIAVWTLDWSKKVKNVEIDDNQVYGNVVNYISLSMGIDDVKIVDNHSYSFDGSNPLKMLDIVRAISEPIATTTLEINSTTKGIYTAKNKWYSYQSAPCTINLSTYTGICEQIIIEDSDIKGTQGYGSSITVNNAPCLIRGNRLHESSQAIAITGSKKVYILDNLIDNMSNYAFDLPSATNFVQEGNYYNGAPMGEGIATIAISGTSVVVTHSLGYTPTLIACTPRGNIGNVWISNITSTQFTINCSTAPTVATAVTYKAK